MKSLIKSSFLALCVIYASAFAQSSAPRIAVYVSGLDSEAEREILASEFLAALVQSKKYVAIERGAAFLSEVERELVTQMGGGVSDDQILSAGMSFGAEFLCVVRVTSAFGVKRVTASIINVESKAVVATGNADSQLSGIADVTEVSGRIVGFILENAVRSRVAEQIFVDSRDGKSYRVMEIGGVTWFVQELNYGKDKYTHGEAMRACPGGWRVPANSDWNALRKSLTDDIRGAFTKTSSGEWWSATTGDRHVTNKTMSVPVRKIYGTADYLFFSRDGLVRQEVDTDGCNKKYPFCNPRYYVRCVKN